ncbi:hypothetical protein ABQE44_23300 [Mycolicibacterium sp. XJ2546]
MPDFSRLANVWTEWTRRIGMANVSVDPARGDAEIGFFSDDQSFFLREQNGWWKIDVVDDRGRRYSDTATFSTFDLAEKYLVWRWGSLLRSALRAKLYGTELYASGPNNDVSVGPSDKEWFVELQSDAGRARLAEPAATIFSHLMAKSVEELEQAAVEGIA